MTTPGTLPSCEILYVDDEEKALKYFRMAFASKFNIHIATSGKEGLEILRAKGSQIGIVISDQRMPEMLGAEFLGQVRQEFPHVVRILTTAYSDLESAIQAVNRGHIYQYVVKPWEVKDFGMVLQRAADYHHILSERNQLLALKMSTLQRILSGDRLIWLLAHARALAPEQQAIFGTALQTYIKALPDPAKALTVSGGVEHFDANKILQGEYANAAHVLADLAKPSTLDEQLSRFSGAVAEKYGIAPDAVAVNQTGGNVEIRISNTGSNEQLTRGIFGLLLAKVVDEVGLSFFRILLEISAKKGGLTLHIGGLNEGTVYSYQTSESLLTGPESVIDALYERVSAWDVAVL